MKNHTLPTNFESYEQLSVCSNLLNGGGQVVILGTEFPLIIGKGNNGVPLVWLKAPIGNNGEFQELARASVATHSIVNVRRANSSIEVYIGGKKLLIVEEKSESLASVEFLDLRYIGLDVHGDTNFLMAGGSRFMGNMVSGSIALISFVFGQDDPPQAQASKV